MRTSDAKRDEEALCREGLSGCVAQAGARMLGFRSGLVARWRGGGERSA